MTATLPPIGSVLMRAAPTAAQPATVASPGPRALTAALALAAVCLPLLRPVGPGNTGVIDLTMLLVIFLAGGWAVRERHRLHLPYVLPVALTVTAGALAALSPRYQGAPVVAALALGQDLFVWAWAAAIATAGQNVRLLDVFCRAWAYSTVAWALVLILAEIAGITWISGIHASDGIRASLTLGDPNLAANYFLLGLMVMRATQRPRHLGWRWLAYALTVVGILLTLSNGGILALLTATTLGALFALARRRGVMVALAAGLAMVVVGLGAAAAAAVNVPQAVDRVTSSSPYLRDSIGRHEESTGSRVELAREGVRLWLSEDRLLGFGPSGTENALRARQAPYVKEAHNDYLAALNERGVLGGLALLLLMAGIAMRCHRISRAAGPPPPWRAVVPRPELLAATVVAIALSGMFYEVLHFRHVWALFGLIAALELSRRRPTEISP